MTPMTTQEMDTLLSQAGDAGIIRYRYGKSAAWRRIPIDRHLDIKSRFKSGESKESIASSYGVTRQAINYLLKKWGMV